MNFDEVKKCVHEIIDVYNSTFKDGSIFPPILDHVGGDEHENGLKPYI